MYTHTGASTRSAPLTQSLPEMADSGRDPVSKGVEETPQNEGPQTKIRPTFFSVRLFLSYFLNQTDHNI